MTVYTTSVGPPGFVTTPVSSAPKRPGESWVDRDALLWDASNRYWRRTTSGAGQAIADGAALSAATDATIRIRPVLFVRRQGRGSSASAPGIARLEVKASGQTFTANASVYRQCNPSAVDYGQCYSGTGTGRRQIGRAALAAVAGDANVLVWHEGSTTDGIPHVPFSSRLVNWSMASINVVSGGVTATGKATTTLDATSPAATAGGYIFRGHNGEINASAATGGAGKVFLGRSANAANPGDLVEYGWWSNHYENDMNAWLAIGEKLDCVLLTCPDMTDSADVTARAALALTLEVDRTEYQDALATTDSYQLKVFGFSDYEPQTLANYTNFAYGEFACTFPFSQLSGDFAGKVPADAILVFGGRARMGVDTATTVGVDIRHTTVPGSVIANTRTWRNITEVQSNGNATFVVGNSNSDFVRRSVRMPSGRYVRQFSVSDGGNPSNAVDGGQFGRPRRARFYVPAISDATYSAARVVIRRTNPDTTTTDLETINLTTSYSSAGSSVYTGTKTAPTWLHALELRRTLVYAFQRYHIANAAWENATGTAWLDPFNALCPPWRIPKMYVAGSPSSYIAAEGYVETGLDWAEPTWSNSVSTSTSTVGVNTQITFSGSVSASVSEPGTQRFVSTSAVVRTVALYDPDTGLWLNTAEEFPATYVATFWHTFPRRFPVTAPIQVRNATGTTKTLQWVMYCAQLVTQLGGPTTYGTVIRGTVDIPST